LVNNDKIIRSGTVDQDAWEQAVTVLGTIELSGQISDETGNSINITSPDRNATVTPPLLIEGEAPGDWYFEATFPIVLTDWDGRIIAEGYAQATDDWMTSDMVPFEATIEFESPYESTDQYFMSRGSLILQKANPSGLPANDASVELPVRFAPNGV
jgi:hypothetical protein